ncbi:hypothetical protein BBP40_000743 [Aspergillus hancockii]|nr:hypothetical protein BBP40_000743 [Aspergillus hancockii]
MALYVPSHVSSLHRASGAQIRDFKYENPYKYRIAPALDKSQEPLIPAPQLFKPLSDVTTPERPQLDLPTISECAVHLELLEVLYNLREKVLISKELDDTFGYKPIKKTVYRKRYSTAKHKYEPYEYTVGDDKFPIRRKAKWPHFLELSVGRFIQWVQTADRLSFSSESAENSLRLGLLPPLDVLMVWHAFLLNPTDFDFYCVKHGLERMRKTPLPWLQIHKAINPRDCTYNLPKPHSDWLEQKAQLKPDLFDALVETGKLNTHAKHILSRSGTSTRRDIPFGTLGNLLSHSEIAFAKSVQTSMTSAYKNKDLIANVERQTSFIDKMNAQLWIRSPAVEGTIRRAIGRYEKFLELFRDYPNTTLVPTLDVDLAWHTHLCNPEQYRVGLVQRAGRVVNHDDKLGKSYLNRRFDKTHELFRVVFGQQYNICLCWDCEAILSAMEDFATSDDIDILDDLDSGADSVVEKVEEEVRYHRAVEIARRRGDSLPVRK